MLICVQWPAERILTQERIKLIQLAMESFTVPTPACYEVATVGKHGQKAPAQGGSPRWMTSRWKDTAHETHGSLPYSLNDRAARKLSTHQALVLTLSGK